MAKSQPTLFADDVAEPPYAGPYAAETPAASKRRGRAPAARHAVVTTPEPAVERPTDDRAAWVACGWPRCDHRVPPAQYLCLDHWFIPCYLLYGDVVRTYAPGEPTAEHVAAVRAIQAWIAKYKEKA